MPATVHEGRYNILCVRLPPGPFDLQCRADDVAESSLLDVHPLNVDGLEPHTRTVSGDGAVMAATGRAAADAHVFFSYAGPFYPVRDGYRLTCRW